MAFNYPQKIVTLWIVFLLGTLFHVQLGLMPLFHGASVSHGDLPDSPDVIARVLWLMLLFFAVPLISIIIMLFSQHRHIRLGHFWLTVVYSVLNFLHLALDLRIVPIVWSQIALMAFLFGVGLLLNVVSWQWLRDRPSSRAWQQIDSYS